MNIAESTIKIGPSGAIIPDSLDIVPEGTIVLSQSTYNVTNRYHLVISSLSVI
jgi:hypothetical protein